VNTFPFAHNWKSPIRETLAWLTDVQEARSGAERRRRVRAHPRRTLEYDVLLPDAEARNVFDALVFKFQNQTVLTPVWTDALRLNAPLFAGSSFLPLAVGPRDFEIGSRAIVWRNWQEWETVELSFIGESEIFFTPTNREWRAGDLIAPLRRATMEDAVRGSAATTALQRTPMRFSISPDDFSERRAVAPESQTYRDWPVWLRPNEFSETQSIETERRRELVDNESGLYFFGSPHTAPKPVRDFRWKLSRRAEIAEFLGFVHERAGKLAPFWTPTWERNFIPTSGLGAGDTVLSFRAFGYARTYNLHPQRRHVALRTAGGEWFFRELVACADASDGVETVTLDAPLGVELPRAQIDRISFLLPHRMDADQVEIDWRSNAFVASNTRMRALIPPQPRLTLPAPVWRDGQEFAGYFPALVIEFDSQALSDLPPGVSYLGTEIYRDGALIATVIDVLGVTDFVDVGIVPGVTHRYRLRNLFTVNGEPATADSRIYTWVLF
jgi:hypothetical protein